mmetsp:Transcript_180/g.200  ORF Transcript_180/g.200 Transcript_180/m.200 type:complete len:364 (+) Transcript_180:3-1094(+)
MGGGGGGEQTLVASIGYWDNSIKVHYIESGRIYTSSKYGSNSLGYTSHRGQINCMSVGSDGYTLVTGGGDGTVRVWLVDRDGVVTTLAEEALQPENQESLADTLASKIRETAADRTSINSVSSSRSSSSLSSSSLSSRNLSSTPRSHRVKVSNDSSGSGSASTSLFGEGSIRCAKVLYGCESPVISVNLNCLLDVIVAGCENGSICLYTVKTGKLIWQHHANSDSGGINCVNLDPISGDVIAHSWAKKTLQIFTINGILKKTIICDENMNVIKFSRSGSTLVCGKSSGVVSFYSRPNLELLHEINLGSPVECLSVSPTGNEIMCGTSNGKLYMLCDPAEAFKRYLNGVDNDASTSIANLTELY